MMLQYADRLLRPILPDPLGMALQPWALVNLEAEFHAAEAPVFVEPANLQMNGTASL
jgi:hypothetical protein